MLLVAGACALPLSWARAPPPPALPSLSAGPPARCKHRLAPRCAAAVQQAESAGVQQSPARPRGPCTARQPVWGDCASRRWSHESVCTLHGRSMQRQIPRFLPWMLLDQATQPHNMSSEVGELEVRRLLHGWKAPHRRLRSGAVRAGPTAGSSYEGLSAVHVSGGGSCAGRARPILQAHPDGPPAALLTAEKCATRLQAPHDSRVPRETLPSKAAIARRKYEAIRSLSNAGGSTDGSSRCAERAVSTAAASSASQCLRGQGGRQRRMALTDGGPARPCSSVWKSGWPG